MVLVRHFPAYGVMLMLQKVYQQALPRLEGKKVRDAVIGLELLAVELDDGAVGVAYVLRKELPAGCASLPEAGKINGMRAEVLASWMLDGKNPLRTALGLAACNAVAPYDELSPEAQDASSALEARPGDTLGMVGYIRPLAARLKHRVNRMIIFDRACSQDVYPEERQEELLPQCDLVVITSSSLINGTFSKVISLCSGAREIVLTGASTPMYPQAFEGTKVTVLAGCRWFPQHKREIFTGIAQAASLRQIIGCGEKLTVRLKKPRN